MTYMTGLWLIIIPLISILFFGLIVFALILLVLALIKYLKKSSRLKSIFIKN